MTPGNASTTTSPGFKGGPVPDLQSVAPRPQLLQRDPRQSRNRTIRQQARPQGQQVAEPNSGPFQLLPAGATDHADEGFFLGTAHHIPNSIAFAYGFTAVDFTPMLA
jgi:hypothetical protein